MYYLKLIQLFIWSKVKYLRWAPLYLKHKILGNDEFAATISEVTATKEFLIDDVFVSKEMRRWTNFLIEDADLSEITVDEILYIRHNMDKKKIYSKFGKLMQGKEIYPLLVKLDECGVIDRHLDEAKLFEESFYCSKEPLMRREMIRDTDYLVG